MAPRKIKLNELYLFCFPWIEFWDPQRNIIEDTMQDVRERDLDFTPWTGTEFIGDGMESQVDDYFATRFSLSCACFH